MANSFIGIDEPATIDKKADTEQLTVGANTVERERVEISGAADVEIARVTNADAAGTEYGVHTRPTSHPPNRTASGALGALNAAVTISQQGVGITHWEIDTGTLVGTVVFEATLDDTNWFAVNAIRIDGTIISSTTTFADRGTLVGGGFSQVRLRVSAYTSGTSNARLEASGDTHIVRLGQAIPPGTNNIGDVDIASLPNEGQQTMANSISVAIASDQANVPVSQATASALNAEVQGDVAHDAAIGGNPVIVGGVSETPDDTAPANQVTAEAEATRFAVDRDGALYTHPHPPRIWHASAEYTTAQTDTSVKAAPGAGLSLYITDIYIAVNAAVNVTLEEGTTTLKWKYYGSGQGDGVSANLTTPIKLTANTALTVTTSGAVNVTLVVTGYTAP